VNNRLQNLSCASIALDTAARFIASLDTQGDERATVSAMKIFSYLTKASMEVASMMILAAPAGTRTEGLAAAISEASSEVERLEIESINREAALEDGK
jgi:hypothetical protein